MHSLLPLSLPLSLLILLHASPVHGVRFPFTVRHTDLNQRANGLARRGNGSIPLSNNANAQYIASLKLAGTDARVLLDTGSSDLWINFPDTPPTTQDTGESLQLNYAIGATSGHIHKGDVEFDDYTLKDQAFLLVTDSSSFSTDIHSQGYDGLMGIGPNEGSQIMDKLDADDNSGDTVLNRIFQSNRSADNFISFSLDRKNDPTQEVTGQFTISAVVPGLEAVLDMPKLDVETVHRLLGEDQHWQALTDKDNGFIGPDGKVIDIDSIVPKAPDGQLVVVFDSGFTFNQVPRDLADAIYGRVQGAVYDSKNEWWTVPCGQMLNVTVNFGGRSYPVHPLDTVDDNFGIKDANGNPTCIGTFQPITTAFSLLGNYDIIMGMAFLRNTYTLLDFGNWVDDTDNKGDPYIQLLSVTDPNVAHSDFVQRRLNGVDTTGDAQWQLLSADQMQHSPVSEEEKKKKYQEMILSRWPYILTGCLVGTILLIAFIVWRCCRRRRARRAAAANKTSTPGGATFKNPFGKNNGQSEAYLPLTAQGSSVNLSQYPNQPPPQYQQNPYQYHQ